MRRTDAFWVLLKTGVAIGRKAWRPRKIEVLRRTSVTIEGVSHRLTQLIDLTQGHRPRLRMAFHLDGAQPTDAAALAFVTSASAVFGSASRVRFYDRKVFVSGPLKATRQIDSALKEVRDGLLGARPRSRRASKPGRRWSVPRVRRLIGQLLREGRGTWTPEYGNFRQVRTFSVGGYRWTAYLDGLWNEWDRELSVWVQTRDDVTRRDWSKIKASGFVEGLAEHLKRLGFRGSLRARFERFPRGARDKRVFVEFSKPVDSESLDREARKLLAWRIPAPFPFRPQARPSPRLFLPERAARRSRA